MNHSCGVPDDKKYFRKRTLKYENISGSNTGKLREKKKLTKEHDHGFPNTVYRFRGSVVSMDALWSGGGRDRDGGCMRHTDGK
jgi:hypothetical protein